MKTEAAIKSVFAFIMKPFSTVFTTEKLLLLLLQPSVSIL